MTSQLLIVSFYFLFWVGECTKPNRETRADQFRIRDLLSWENNKSISPLTTPVEELIDIKRGR